MRHVIGLKAALAGGMFGVLFCAVPSEAQLLNGNLDATSVSTQVLATPTNWDVLSSRTISGPFNDGASSEPWAGPAPTPVTPNDMGLFYKPFHGNLGTGDLITTHLMQALPTTPGTPWFLDGWAGAEPNYSGLIAGSPTRSVFALEFLNMGGTVLAGSVELDLKANNLGVPNGHPFAYRKYSLNGVAPAGAAFVRARASMIDGYNTQLGGQAFVVDDFTLVIPEPASLSVLSLGALALLRRRSA